MHLTLLYDDTCRVCVPFARWVADQPLLVPLDLVPCGSPAARERFPALDHAATKATVTVVGDEGEVWTHDAAWLMVLWATRTHRPLACRLAGSAAGRALARGAAYAAAGLRHAVGGSGGGGDYADRCVDACAPIREG